VYIRRKGVVKFVINRCERLSSNQAEIRPRVVPPGFWGSVNRGTLYFSANKRFVSLVASISANLTYSIRNRFAYASYRI
jgi:hypothetical protein